MPGNYARVASHCANLGILHTKLCEWEQARDASAAGRVDPSRSEQFLRADQGTAGPRHAPSAAPGSANWPRPATPRRASSARSTPTARELVLCWEAEGDLLLDAGRLRDADEGLRRGLELAVHVAPEGDLVPELQRRLAQVALEEGRLGEARRFAARSAHGARKVGDNAEAGAAMRVLAEALSRKGRHKAAEQAFHRSIELLRQTPERMELALAQVALARALGPARQREPRRP